MVEHGSYAAWTQAVRERPDGPVPPARGRSKTYYVHMRAGFEKLIRSNAAVRATGVSCAAARGAIIVISADTYGFRAHHTSYVIVAYHVGRSSNNTALGVLATCKRVLVLGGAAAHTCVEREIRYMPMDVRDLRAV